MRRLSAARARNLADRLSRPGPHHLDARQMRDVVYALRVAADALEMGEDSDDLERKNAKLRSGTHGN